MVGRQSLDGEVEFAFVRPTLRCQGEEMRSATASDREKTSAWNWEADQSLGSLQRPFAERPRCRRKKSSTTSSSS